MKSLFDPPDKPDEPLARSDDDPLFRVTMEYQPNSATKYAGLGPVHVVGIRTAETIKQDNRHRLTGSPVFRWLGYLSFACGLASLLGVAKLPIGGAPVQIAAASMFVSLGSLFVLMATQPESFVTASRATKFSAEGATFSWFFIWLALPALIAPMLHPPGADQLGSRAPAFLIAAAGAVIGLLLGILVSRRFGKSHPWGLVTTFTLYLAGFAFGAAQYFDTVFDTASAQVFETHVVEHPLDTPDNSDTPGSVSNAPQWETRVGPWGPVAQSLWVNGYSKEFNGMNVGDVVCANLHPGLIGVTWYAIHRCKAAAGRLR